MGQCRNGLNIRGYREKVDEKEEKEGNIRGENIWLPPQEGIIKLNFDATVDTRKGKFS